MKYQITYTAVYYVDADNKADAEQKGMSRHENNPDGTWEVIRDPYASPLEQLPDGTYSITEAHSVPLRVFRSSGYWVGTVPVLSLDDVPRDGFLGVWTDPAGTRYYDLSRHIEDLTEALAVASYYDQQSIWDIAEEREIPVNV